MRIILIRGAGDLASGVALRLHRRTECRHDRAGRSARGTAHGLTADAIFDGRIQVENVLGRRVEDPTDTIKILSILSSNQIPVLVDPECTATRQLHPIVIVDGRMLKSAPEPLEHSADLYIGLGPGFSTPVNCDAVIETQRGHSMGRVIHEGSSQDDSARPDGDARRVLRSPADGPLESVAQIGQHFEQGQAIATVSGMFVTAPFAGILRGLLRPGIRAREGMKIGDLDSRDDPMLCRLVSDKSLAIGGGVLEAILGQPDIRAKLWP
jgi:xanthine dehydrogenase accessory factor